MRTTISVWLADVDVGRWGGTGGVEVASLAGEGEGVCVGEGTAERVVVEVGEDIGFPEEVAQRGGT